MMSGRKCPRCGMVNWAGDAACRRCGASFERRARQRAGEEAGAPARTRSLARRLLFIAGALLLFVLSAYASLLLTSERVNAEQRRTVERAVDVLAQNGFGREAFILRRLASYRTTDNWWNRWVGHREAYAATNFPFEVVTLYPDFFTRPQDDTERAVILLHEAYHLTGAGEEAALRGVWRDKQRLGWTRRRYGQTRVWQNVRDFTAQQVPHLFSCGQDGRGDCLGVE